MILFAIGTLLARAQLLNGIEAKVIPELNVLLQSFSSCFVTMLVMDPTIEVRQLQIPLILGDGNITEFRSNHRLSNRKARFCVVYLILYPPAVSTSEPFSLRLIKSYGIDYNSADEQKLMEPYSLGIVSPLDFSIWWTDKSESVHVAAKFYFKTHPLTHSLTTAGYLCQVCMLGTQVLALILAPLQLNTIFQQLQELEMNMTVLGRVVWWEEFLMPFLNFDELITIPDLQSMRPWTMNKRTRDDVETVMIGIILETTDPDIKDYFNLSVYDTPQLKHFWIPVPWAFDQIEFNGSITLWERGGSAGNFGTALQRDGAFKYTLLGSAGLNFLTCDGVERHEFKFSSFTKPYDSAAWGLIFISGCASILFLTCLRGKSYDVTLFQLGMLYFGILLEQSPFLSNLIEKSTALMRFWKLVFGMWLIFTIVLTNAYKGVVTTDLLAPPEWKPNWTSIFDMPATITIYSPIYYKKFSNVAALIKYYQEYWWFDKILPVTFLLHRNKNFETYTNLYHYCILHYDSCVTHQFHSNLINTFTQFEARPDLFYSALLSCENKVFVTEDLGNSITLYENYFNAMSGKRLFFRGKETFWDRKYHMQMPSHRRPYLNLAHLRMEGLMSSGIYNLFLRWTALFRLMNATRITDIQSAAEAECISPCKIGLGPQILYTFLMYSTGLIVSSLIFGVEFIRRSLLNFRTTVHKFRN